MQDLWDEKKNPGQKKDKFRKKNVFGLPDKMINKKSNSQLPVNSKKQCMIHANKIELNRIGIEEKLTGKKFEALEVDQYVWAGFLVSKIRDSEAGLDYLIPTKWLTFDDSTET